MVREHKPEAVMIKAAFNNNATALWWPDIFLEENHPMTISSTFSSY
jgi:hypothetical protein